MGQSDEPWNQKHLDWLIPLTWVQGRSDGCLEDDLDTLQVGLATCHLAERDEHILSVHWAEEHIIICLF